MTEQQQEAVVATVGHAASGALVAAAVACPPVAVAVGVAVAAGAVYCAVEGSKGGDSGPCSHKFVEKRSASDHSEIYCRTCGARVL